MTNGPEIQGRAPIKVRLAQQLQDRLRLYREKRESIIRDMTRDPDRPARETDLNREIITAELRRLSNLWSEVLPHIRRIKTLAGDILEPTRYAATYLLFGKVANGIEALFTLARRGHYYEVMDVVRSNNEALDLIMLFQHEASDGRYLKKWFEGDIIENREARDAVDPFMADIARAANLTPTMPLKQIKTDIYAALSRYTHVSYSALLDSYALYRQDFDFERDAGFHYLRSNGLSFIREQIRSTILTLKSFYLSIPDKSYRALDAISEKYGLGTQTSLGQ